MIPEISPYNNYKGDGATTQFDFDFYIENGSQLKVEHINKNGIATKLQENIDYTINEIGNNNGSYIIFPKAGSKYSILTDEEIISLQLTLPVSQESEYGKSIELDFKSLEYSLDYITRLIQILYRKQERAVTVQEGSAATPQDLLNTIDDKVTTAINAATTATTEAQAAQNSAIVAEEQATVSTQQAAEVKTTYDEAMTEISNAKTNAIDIVQTVQSKAESAIQYDKEDALSSIGNAKTDALDACDKKIEMAKIYAEESGGKGMPTDICKNLNIEYDIENHKVKLKWKDPNDTVNSLGQIMASWKGTVITCKNLEYPENFDDGDIVVDCKIRNQYKNQELIYDVPVVVQDITQLKFRAFPYSVNGIYNKDEKNCFDNTIVYEFLYDSKNSNVNGSISYPEGCINEFYKPAKMDYTKNVFDYGSWKNAFFMNIQKPCMLYNQNAKDAEGNSLCGKVMEYLNPDDYSKTIDGAASNVANENSNANAMVQWFIKNLWIKIDEYLPKKYHVYVANRRIDESYKNYLRFNKLGQEVDYYYRAMFDGCNINNIIRSLSGKNPCVNVAGNTQIAYARSNGAGHDVDEERFILVRNILLRLIGKSTDSQAVFGTGRHTGGSNTNYNQLPSGQLNDKGAFFSAGENMANKVFHSENPWGNVWKIVQGLLQTGGKLYLKLTPNTNDGTTVEDYQQTSVAGYLDTGITLSGTSGGYISAVTSVAGCGFLPSVVSGSSSTFVPDGCWWNASIVGFARFGGCSNDSLLVGASAVFLGTACSASVWLTACRSLTHLNRGGGNGGNLPLLFEPLGS